MSKYRAASEAN